MYPSAGYFPSSYYVIDQGTDVEKDVSSYLRVILRVVFISGS